jgi:hypothetical protein
MNKNRMHMIPQVVIDCAENFVAAKNPNSRTAYETRLIAIKEYCDFMLKQNVQISVSENYNKRNRK